MAQTHGQEHQEYIQQKVNPILENLVTQLLLERPEHLAPFMIKWLTENSKTPQAAALTEGVNELGTLKEELEKLKGEVKQLEAEVGDKAPPAKAAKGDDDDDEEDEEDDVEDVAPPPPPEYMKRGRTSVSAEAYGQWNQKKEFTPPVYAKTEEQKARIEKVLQASFMFSAMETADVGILVNAMQEKTVEKDTKLINQGDDGDFMYVIESGVLHCFKTTDGQEKLVKECKSGDAFGELALLYNCPRAASVVATEKSILWQLDRETFGAIVREAASKRREKYEEFLKGVTILQSMQTYEIQQMCDALQTVNYKQGDEIVKQGDTGDKFFILEVGECVAKKVYVENTPPQEVMQYKSGDYFGELALIMNEPRAATVIAKNDCRLLWMSRRTFKSLLGPIEDMMKRHAASYK